MYKAISYIDRVIEEKTKEIELQQKNKELFLAEIELIEKALGITDMEKQFQTEVAVEETVATALVETPE